MKLKIKLTIQKEVMNGAILQQVLCATSDFIIWNLKIGLSMSIRLRWWTSPFAISNARTAKHLTRKEPGTLWCKYGSE